MLPAPIAIFAFNRPQCLRRLLADLALCRRIDESEVYIFVDGARGERDAAAVSEVVSIAAGCQMIDHRVISPVNRGLATSLIDGVTQVVSRHGRVIVLEDDLRLAPNFLVYMNQMLDAYEAEPRVFHISGFGLRVRPPRGYTADTYFHIRPSSWGWATWRDRWMSVDWEVKDYDRLRRSPLARWRFCRGGSDLYGMLRDWHDGRNSSWAIRFTYAMHSQGRLSVVPVRSLVANEGFGDSATHCSDINVYPCDMEDGAKDEFRLPASVSINASLCRQAASYHSLWSRFINGRRWRRVKAALASLNRNTHLTESKEARMAGDRVKRVSVVMCTYNGGRFVRQQLDSILHQTYPIYEIIVKDDGSTDDTLDVVEQMSRATSVPIRIVRNRAHEGINGNFFSAMRMAEGEFIAISDQDDIWVLDKIECQMAAIGDRLLCSGMSKPFSGDGSPVEFDSRTPNYSLLRAMYICSLPGHTMLLRRELLDRITQPVDMTYDRQLQIAAMTTGSVAYVEKVLVMHRRLSLSATYTPPSDYTLTPRNIMRKMRESLAYYREIKPMMMEKFAVNLRLLQSIPVESSQKSVAIEMMRLQTTPGLWAWVRLTWLCVANRDDLFHVKDTNIVRSVLRAAYFPVYCSHYFRYLSKTYRR